MLDHTAARARARRRPLSTALALTLLAGVLSLLAAPGAVAADPAPAAPEVSPAVPAPSAAVTVTGRLTTAVRRAVRVETRSSTTTAWRAATSSTTAVDGSYRLPLTAPATAGTLLVRVVAPAAAVVVNRRTTVLPAQTTPTRTVTVRVPDEEHCGALPGDQTWTAARPHVLTCTVTVPAGTTLTIAAGAVVRAARGSALDVRGALLTAGTATAPVLLTSTSDVAGGQPASGDWDGVMVVGAESRARLTGVDLRWAGTCLATSGAREVVVSGRITGCTEGIWTERDWVDARGVDWGTPSGPAPFGSGPRVTGIGAQVLPWAGRTATVARTPDTSSSQPDPADLGCRDLVVYGLRGSGEAPVGTGLDDGRTYAGDLDGFGGLNLTIGWQLVHQLAAWRPELTVKGVAVQYAALMPPTVASWPRTTGADFAASVAQGASRLGSAVRAELARCPGTSFAVIGTSQGALAARDYLRSAGVEAEHLVATVLVGDPGRSASGTETLWESAWTPARDAVRATDGLWASESGPLPDAVAARTISMCHDGDVVCAPRPGAGQDRHLDYDEEQAGSLAFWAAWHAAFMPSVAAGR